MERLTFSVDGAKLEGRTLSGTVHAYGTTTVRDGKVLSFERGAFTTSIQRGEVAMFWSHDTSKPLASQAAGTLRLVDGPEALAFEADLADGISWVDDAKAAIAAKLVNSMSFGYMPSQSKRVGKGTVFTDGALVDISPVAMPAFDRTSLQLHEAQIESPRSVAVRIRNRSLHRRA